MNVPRQMNQAADALLDLLHLSQHIHADGTVTVHERHAHDTALRRVLDHFEQADAGLGLVLTLLKTGPESRSFADKRREYEATYGPLPLHDARTVRLHNETRPNGGNHSDAA